MSKRIEELDKNFQTAPVKTEEGLHWYSPKNAPFVVDGLAWFKENDGEFIRFPKRVKGKLRDALWELGTMSSGGRVRFKTDSTTLRIRAQHSRDELAMHHMTAVGVSGFDLYEGPPRKMRFWCSARPLIVKKPYVSPLLAGLPKKMREFTLYLPTYNDLVLLEIGLDPNAQLAAPSAYRRKRPIIFYGTSVTQGGCSSRTGTGFVPRVGRRLGVDVLNFGFSGNGHCDPELIPLFNEIDPAAMVIDCVANMGLERMQTRYAPFLEALRKDRPKLPLLLLTIFHVPRESYANDGGLDKVNAIVLETYRQMRARGDRNVHLLDTRKVIGHELDHPSVDGVHLTDLGFYWMAEALAPVLKKLL